MIRPWEKVGSKQLADFRIFTVRSDTKVSPRTGKHHDFYIIDSVHWVNVVATTPDRQVVMVEQYRHGTNTVELEIPGGLMDAGDLRPELTGVRELREETGLTAKKWTLLTRLHTSNSVTDEEGFLFLAEDLGHGASELEETEADLQVKKLPLKEALEMVLGQEITDSMSMIGILLAARLKRV